MLRHLVGKFKYRNNLHVADISNMTITNVTTTTKTYGISQSTRKSGRNNSNISTSFTYNTKTMAAQKASSTATATPTTSTATTATKLNGLMSMQLAVVLLVFLLADSGLNGLSLVTALKGKFEIKYV